MRDTQPYSEAKIEIGSIEFDKKGSIYISGFVEGIEVEKLIEADSAEFDQFLPKNCIELEFIDQNDLYSAMLDDFHNLHWLVKSGMNIIYRVVRLESLIKEILYELYTEQS